MTETQAKSGGSGTSTTPVDEEPAEGGSAATGRTAVGRAVVPADAPSPPKFTRAPGMNPPPDEPPADSDDQSEPERPATGNAKVTTAVPIVTKSGKGAAGSRGPAGQQVQQGGAEARTSVQPPVTPGITPARPARPAGPNAPGRPGQATPGRSGQSAPGRPGQAAPARPGTPGEAPKRAGAPSGSAAVGAARVGEAVRSARTAVSSAATRGPRRARLNLKRIDPWSVMKFSFAVSVVLFIVVVVATSVLYLALDAMGVWGEVNQSLTDLVSASGGAGDTASSGFRITAWGVIGTSMLIGAVNVVLFTALATLSAFIYNVCADLVGGVELTLAERD